MKIALCIKQVPDTSDIKWTENNTINREGVESIINPYDVYALEAALQIKKLNPATKITALTMGPQQAVSMLKKTIALGVDKGLLISDKKFAGSDTYATGKTISKAIQTAIPDYSMVICGQFAIDGDTAQTGPSIANHLNIPQVTFVKEILSCDETHIIVKRQADEGIETIKAELPVLLCMQMGDFEPTRALIDGYKKAQNAEISTLTMEDLGLTAEEVGIKGSPTYVSKAFRPIITRNSEKITYTENSAEILKSKLTEYMAGANE